MKRHFLYTYIFLFLLTGISGKGYSQGLQFYGNEKRIAERSSYRVFTDEHIPAPTGRFDISFEYATNNAQSPGYILYLKNADGEDAFNLTYVHKDGKRCFMFARDGKQIYDTAEYDDRQTEGKWMPVTLQLDFAGNRAEVRIGSHRTTLDDIGLAGQTFTPQPFFGMCNYILETASFSLRNLTISNGKQSWHFPLNESKGEKVHDGEGKIIGHITNPVWLINSSYHWKPVLHSYSATPSGLLFDRQKQQFHIYNQDSITTYDLHRQQVEQLSYEAASGKLPTRLGMNLTDEAHSTVYAYELNWEGTYIAELNPETRTWKKITPEAPTLQMHHHCGLCDSLRGRLLLFGGYGNRRYYNHFITYDFARSRWDTLTCSGDIIPPRFFAAMTATPDYKYAYIYGGKGNEAGDQNVGIQYYYDLYRVDLETMHIQKLWEHKAPHTNRVPARNMVLSEDGKYLYLLAYPEYMPETRLQMYRISLADGSHEALGSSLPLVSEEIATNANLYFNPEQDEFYCTIQEFEKYGENTTRIYSLANPPMSLADIEFYDTPAHTPKRTAGWLYPALIALAVAATGGIVFVRRRRRKPVQPVATPVAEAMPATEAISETEAMPATEHTASSASAPAPREQAMEKEEKEEPEQDPLLPEVKIARSNSLSLFGTFYATDRNGRDITYMFSPKIRHLFLYLLVNSIHKDGVLSSDLNSLFWPDKPDDKIKNLKNVTLNHLRKTLQEMEGIELTHRKGYFKIQLAENCYCDYQRFFSLTGGMSRIPTADDEVKELYGICSQGKFLSSIESGLFDYCKQQVESFILALLSEQIYLLYKNGKNTATLRICNIWFNIDPISDMAMTYAVCCYRRQNRPDKAMQLYGNFIKEYQKLMGEEYPVAFEKIAIENIRL